MTALYMLWQMSWGIIQTLAGAVLFLGNLGKRHYRYHGAVVTEWEYSGSVSLGMFIFLSSRPEEKSRRKVLTHEYGHTIQSLILGPLYLLVIGLPSVVWAGLPPLARLRARRNISYYRLYTERWANFLGRKVTGEETPL